MHGLINRSLQSFLSGTYGAPVWHHIRRTAGVGPEGFEPLLIYENAVTEAVVSAAATILSKPRDSVLEDLGTYLVSNPHSEALRRLLRFGGVSFVDFLHSIEDLPEHGRLGLPDFDLPDFTLIEVSAVEFSLNITPLFAGVGHVVVGLLRAMADDYGSLVMLDHAGAQNGCESISILLLDHAHSQGRSFDLVIPEG